MKSNANLVDLIEKVKPEIRTLIEKCNTVSNLIRHSPPATAVYLCHVVLLWGSVHLIFPLQPPTCGVLLLS